MAPTDFEKLYQAYYMQVYSYVMTLVMDPFLAEEITQQAFFQALTKKDGGTGEMITITKKSFNEKDLIMIGVVEGRSVQTLPCVSESGSSDTCSNSSSTGTASSGSETIIMNAEALAKHKETMASARDAATKKMIEEAEAMGADAIVCVRYSSAPGKNVTSENQKTTEVMAYGTAVKYRE